MSKTTMENLAEVSDLLERAIERIRCGEVFPLDFADDWLYTFFGAVVELARLSNEGSREDLVRAEAFLASLDRQVDDGDEIVFTAENLEALQSLQSLVRTTQPVAETLDQEKQLYALVNPVHYQGNTLLCENDRGVYESPWAALADLAEVKRRNQNPNIYLACLTALVSGDSG